jgi:hypothetical protein
MVCDAATDDAVPFFDSRRCPGFASRIGLADMSVDGTARANAVGVVVEVVAQTRLPLAFTGSGRSESSTGYR